MAAASMLSHHPRAAPDDLRPALRHAGPDHGRGEIGPPHGNRRDRPARKALRRLPRAQGRQLHRRGRRVRRARRPLGLRQIHAAPRPSPASRTSTAGTIRIDGRDVNDLEPRDRDIAMVFQSYALYPHMTVRDNIGLQPRASGRRRRPRSTPRVDRGRAHPRHRRAPRPQAARPLRRPAPARRHGPGHRPPARRLFLFDEPLSNLDAKLRVQMRAEIRALHDRLGATSVYVTHDQVEAMTMADRIVVLDAGRIVQVGAPLELYQRPVNRFVAELHRLAGDQHLRRRPSSPTAPCASPAAASSAAASRRPPGPVTSASAPRTSRPPRRRRHAAP